MKNKTKSSDSENPAQIEVPKIVQIEDYLFGAHNYRLNLVANDLERSAKGQNTFVAVADEQLAYELFRAGFKGFGQQLAALIKSEAIPRADPLKEYFERLPVWVEGEDPDYIQQLAEYVTASDPNWFRLRFKKALVRAAACALEVLDFNKQCLVLAGKQDDGKTSFLRYLCPLALRENYTEQVEFGNKDGQIALATNFIINIDELKGLERQEITRLKAFFTTASVKLRRPYDKKDSWAKRKASFFASTNDRTFLTDETGNVRWLIFDISSVKHDNGGPNGYQVIPIDRVWSQACALLKSGFEFRLTKPEIAMSEKINNANYSRTTVEIDLVQEYLQPADRREPGAEFMNTTNVMMYLQEKAPTMRNIHVLGVGKALTFLRFSEDSQRINGSPRKGYWVKKIENGNATLLPDYKEAEPLKEKDLVVVPF